ncbi:MAG: Gfo/Idh/MocA family oxidoreductase, partial [Bacteroidota bacterium]|nr:Gfo/Idh/MocA family oxidoreductase [Bacteroidota bacterium]
MQQDSIVNKNTSTPIETVSKLPKLGFLGVGWIGRNRLEVIAKNQAGEVVKISDTLPANTEEALKTAPNAEAVNSLEEMLTADVDGVVIATPSA